MSKEKMFDYILKCHEDFLKIKGGFSEKEIIWTFCLIIVDIVRSFYFPLNCSTKIPISVIGTPLIGGLVSISPFVLAYFMINFYSQESFIVEKNKNSVEMCIYKFSILGVVVAPWVLIILIGGNVFYNNEVHFYTIISLIIVSLIIEFFQKTNRSKRIRVLGKETSSVLYLILWVMGFLFFAKHIVTFVKDRGEPLLLQYGLVIVEVWVLYIFVFILIKFLYINSFKERLERFEKRLLYLNLKDEEFQLIFTVNYCEENIEEKISLLYSLFINIKENRENELSKFQTEYESVKKNQKVSLVRRINISFIKPLEFLREEIVFFANHNEENKKIKEIKKWLEWTISRANFSFHR